MKTKVSGAGGPAGGGDGQSHFIGPKRGNVNGYYNFTFIFLDVVAGVVCVATASQKFGNFGAADMKTLNALNQLPPTSLDRF